MQASAVLLIGCMLRLRILRELNNEEDHFIILFVCFPVSSFDKCTGTVE
jgi:hypothetical protein